MRKMKKINGYLVVRFNDREKREYEGTALGNFGVIDAELYTGILDVDRSVKGLASELTTGSKAQQGVKEYLRCSRSARCSTTTHSRGGGR